MSQTVSYSCPFPVDSLNPFGDYKALVLTAIRETNAVDAPIKKTWSLVGDVKLPPKNQLPRRVLMNEKEIRSALETVFLNHASLVT